MYNQAELRSAQILNKARQGFVWFSEIGSHQANGLELIETKLPLTQIHLLPTPGIKDVTTMPTFYFKIRSYIVQASSEFPLQTELQILSPLPSPRIPCTCQTGSGSHYVLCMWQGSQLLRHMGLQVPLCPDENCLF